ncbi:MAG: flagellar basal body rod protein FlgC [Pseudomonadota bacterium]
MDLFKGMKISASGMKAQGTRLRIISENIANANSTGQVPGELPYRRKTIFFKEKLDRELFANVVEVKKIDVDRKPFELRYSPGHPAANSDGYLAMPNVNTIIEMADMREAQRSYEANLNVLDTSRQMIQRTIDLLR